MYFIWLPSPELAIQRVAKREREGGHNIRDAVVRRRYTRGLTNLFDLYIPIVTTVCVYEGASFPPIPMAEIEGEKKLVLDYNGASNEHGSILRWLIFSLLHAPFMRNDSVSITEDSAGRVCPFMLSFFFSFFSPGVEYPVAFLRWAT